jgi:hypothetical protein
MSVPVLSGLTTISRADNNTGWSGWGQNSGKWGTSSDFVKEGSASNALAPFQTGDGGWGFQTGSNIDLSSNLLMIWVNVGSPAFVSTFGSTPAGVYIRITDSTTSWTTTYDDYYVGGSDVAWVGRGWHLIVLDANARTRDRGSGTVTLSSVRRIGVGFNITATAAKSDICMIDHMFYGASMEVTGPSFSDGTNGIDINSGGTIDRNDGGSFVTDGWEIGDFVKITGSATAANDGVWEITGVAAGVLTTGETFTQDTANTTAQIFASVTLEDIYQKDGVTDDDWYSPVDKPPDGGYVINYPLALGDASGALDLFFLSRGESIIFADQLLPFASAYAFLLHQEDTGETHILFGNSIGTGESRVGYGGSVFLAQPTIFSNGSLAGIDFTNSVTACEVYGSSFINCSTIALENAASLTDHRFIGCSIQNPYGLLAPGGYQVRDLVISGFPSNIGAASMFWNTNTDIKRSSFLANYWAIYHDDPGSVTYDALTFGGNTYDIRYNDALDLTVNATNDSNPVTVYEDSSGTVTIQNTKTLTVIVQESDGTKISGVRVGIYQTSDGTQIHTGTTDVNGVVQKTDYNYTVDTAVYVRARLSPSGSTRYTPAEQSGTITTDGLNIVVTLFEDEIAA